MYRYHRGSYNTGWELHPRALGAAPLSVVVSNHGRPFPVWTAVISDVSTVHRGLGRGECAAVVNGCPALGRGGDFNATTVRGKRFCDLGKCGEIAIAARPYGAKPDSVSPRRPPPAQVQHAVFDILRVSRP